MENHPIPQDITGFQFKLIGDMTIKQFAYVASGVVIGGIFYILPIYSFIKYPIIVFSMGMGAALAFLPVAGRPFDVMIENFFKAIFRPTQYAYQKTSDLALQMSAMGAQPSLAELSGQQLKSFIGALPKTPKNKLDEKETVFFEHLASYSASPTPPALQPAAPHAYADKTPPPSVKKTGEAPRETVVQDESLQKEAMLLEKELSEAKAKEAMQTQINSKEYLEAHQKVLELQKNLSDTLLQKQQLETQLLELQKQIQASSGPVFKPTLAHEEPQKQTQFVRSIPETMQKGVGLPIAPEFPNIITGIVKDPRGNPLPNILVEVKDSQENAVRAFKTNALGQFASATPLANGRYTISFEDQKEQNKFDSVAFDVNGQIILPIEVISVDNREELRRSLFN